MTAASAAALVITDKVLLDFAVNVGETGPVAVEGNRTRWDLGGPPPTRNPAREGPHRHR